MTSEPTSRQTFHHASRRSLLLGLAAFGYASMARPAPPQPLSAQVWKDPGCGCCEGWVAHLKKNGFSVTVINQGNDAARARLGMPQQFASCHTALIQNYVIEGHVPAADILRLLKEQPQAVGLAAPGMPIGAPGMDDPAYGGRRDPYQVLLVRKDGSASVFHAYT
jgi:hypothetical protein